MISSAKSATQSPVAVDLHPTRPDYRGFVLKGEPVSFPADPTWEEIESAGATVQKSSQAHRIIVRMTATDDGPSPRTASSIFEG
jgi:7,8-dihydropterin-6-yl-methyl-4-(beta-D-ribofuranosyl)aminobenzene 5'-phosphate synthase